ncbi:alpha-hydroxy acid oxidase [Ottowia thiooxydans]|uniref:alpha-hydroxy acid oxidase n=1 Tax=Ottowia thiooxydans TaxID=219182 RepID=UPI0004167F69|nr:alpha-hydroxy acid oxidase [Ottowia thiooxydans]
MADLLNIADYREQARKLLPHGLFEFVDRGTEDEVALFNNRRAFEAIKLVPRTLVDVSQRSAATSLFGKPLKMPLAIAPTGAAGLMWHDGEIALAQAAATAGIPFTVATGSLTSMERVAREAGGSLWFQLYMWPDRKASYGLVARAEAAGYEALVVTVDTAVGSNREYNVRNGFTIPFRFSARNVLDVMSSPRWMLRVLARYALTTGLPQYENYPPEMRRSVVARPMGKAMKKTDALTWEDLRELRRVWPRTLIVKGILDPGDAARAIECGADGIVISNHGGRMLDSSIAPLDALPGIAKTVQKRVPLLLDGGIQRGSDIAKALALGADAVLVGRSTLYGLAVSGERGAGHVLALLHEELVRVMGLIGRPLISDLDTHCLV